MDRLNKDKLWTRDFVLIILVNLMTFTTMYVMSSSMSLYADNLGASPAITGLLVLLFALASAITRLAIGPLSDRFGRRIFMVVGSLIFTASVFGFGMLAIIPMLLLTRTVQGIGFGSVNTASAAAAADVIPKHRMGEGLGYYGLGMALAMALGPVLGLALANRDEFKLLYLLTAGILFLCFVISLLITYEKKTKAAEKHHIEALETGGGKKARGIWLIIEKKTLPTSLVYLLFAIAMASLISFLPLYAKESQIGTVSIFGFELGIITMFYFAEAVAVFVVRMLAGRLFDRLGPLPVIIPSMLIGAMAFVLFNLSSGGWMFLLSAILFGLSLGVNLPVFNALAIQSAPASRRGAASATFLLFIDIGIGVGGGIWGVLLNISSRDYSLMFWGSAICMVLAMLGSIVIYRKKRIRQQP